jgi:hypothetical protein
MTLEIGLPMILPKSLVLAGLPELKTDAFSQAIKGSLG